MCNSFRIIWKGKPRSLSSRYNFLKLFIVELENLDKYTQNK